MHSYFTRFHLRPSAPSAVSFRSRRGMALILVLGMIAITMAVCYSLMRFQTQATLLQNNSQNGDLARRAAEAGLLRAIRKMSTGTWGGVGTTLTGNVDSQSSYSVTYTAGDTSLSSSDPNYSELPFRVTVSSTGTALNNGDSNLPTTYKMTAVLQLVRRALNTSATPSNWSTMNGYTCYQWNSSTTPYIVNVDFPIQFQGPTCWLGTLKFCRGYDPDISSGARQQYLDDQRKKKQETGADIRVFTGDVTLGSGASRQDSDTEGSIKNWQGVNVNYAAPPNAAPVSYSSAPSTYRLYSGGPTYSVPNLTTTYGSTITAQTIGANITTNPLGLYSSGGTVTLDNGTSFNGVLFSDGALDEVRLSGTGAVSGLNLPAISGGSTTYQLPAAMVRNNFVVKSSSSARFHGLLMAWSNLVVESGPQTTVLNFQGRVFADDLDLRQRTEFDNFSNVFWTVSKLLFSAQNTIKYYPDFLTTNPFNLISAPNITFAPPVGVSYHWPDWSQPIYTSATGDSGLRWDIITWRDGS